MRLAIFAHFDKHHQIKKYVLHYLEQLKQVSDYIIFVSTSKLNDSECFNLSQFCSRVIVRENIGHDFYSYKVGINAIENLKEVEQLILCNDSCFGPLFPLSDIFVQMTSKPADFWGMSANSRPQFHLQSYFLVFKYNVINSEIFNLFWNGVQTLKSKDQIVFDYEVGLSQKLIAVGFTAESFLPLIDYQIDHVDLFKRKLFIYLKELANPHSRYSWKTLLEPLSRIDKTISLFDYSITNYRFPFLKKSLFSDRWVNQGKLFDLIIRQTNYVPDLIKEVINE